MYIVLEIICGKEIFFTSVAFLTDNKAVHLCYLLLVNKDGIYPYICIIDSNLTSFIAKHLFVNTFVSLWKSDLLTEQFASATLFNTVEMY